MKIFLIILNWLKSIFIKPKIMIKDHVQNQSHIIDSPDIIKPKKKLTYPKIYRETGRIEHKMPDIAMGFIYKPTSK